MQRNAITATENTPTTVIIIMRIFVSESDFLSVLEVELVVVELSYLVYDASKIT